MGAPIDISGQRFGRLVAIEYTGRAGATGRIWRCVCDCGSTLDVDVGSLRQGNTTSCGCAKLDRLRVFSTATKTKHGRASNRSGKPPERLYVTWFSMMNRCYCRTATNYRYYGALGVTVCARWRESFEAFRADVGEHPGDGWSIDRIDPRGNYEPGNVRWATTTEQANNKRRHHAAAR